MVERRTQWTRRARFEEIRREVVERIGHVLRGMPTAEVDALIRRMTLVQLKYEISDHSRAS
ncbi:MAG: hypothetical protein ABR499_11140 [Gemmatimonadaceae bacterium]